MRFFWGNILLVSMPFASSLYFPRLCLPGSVVHLQGGRFAMSGGPVGRRELQGQPLVQQPRGTTSGAHWPPYLSLVANHLARVATYWTVTPPNLLSLESVQEVDGLRAPSRGAASIA